MKPSDIHLGVSELFSVFIPGFLIVIASITAFEIIDLTNIEAMLGFVLLILSYIVGHIFFAIGSYWDTFYEIRKPVGNEPLLKMVDRLRKVMTQFDSPSINNYQWCRAVLSKLHTEAYKEVLRHEADSKLFRSLIIPILITFTLLLIQYDDWYFSFIALGMAYIAFARYRGKRFKACKVAYMQVIVLAQLRTIGPDESIAEPIAEE